MCVHVCVRVCVCVCVRAHVHACLLVCGWNRCVGVRVRWRGRERRAGVHVSVGVRQDLFRHFFSCAFSHNNSKENNILQCVLMFLLINEHVQLLCT